MQPDDVVARARGCVGAPFRAQGRSVEHGLDCVGLALIAFGIEGQRPRYALRGGEVSAVMAMIADAGLVAVAVGGAAAGDLMLHRAGAQHLHLTIATGDGYVHACGRIGRVVEVRGEAPWVVVGRWRSPEKSSPGGGGGSLQD
ncbi:peptidoglycan endopeptidase [Sphingomonas montanisoli]|uniref:Peptidoglycan endopeptidase n=1 Tax=Sphingomonas montanisoli TaxID=2606412 RepID=A0A5D9CEA0_9SPHN|nr:peptidoglycan endopeptidase [Sphingomonas montanisoli]